MHDLIITREFPPQDGGIAVIAYEIASHLAKKSQSPTVLVYGDTQKKWESTFSDKEQPFEIIRLSTSGSRFQKAFQIYQVASELIREGIVKRIWATTWNLSGVVAACLKKRFKIPYLLMAQGYEISPQALDFIDQWLLRCAFKNASVVTAISRYTRDLLQSRVPSLRHIEVFPHGIDSTRFVQNPPGLEGFKKRYHLNGKKVLLTVARLYARKGHDKVIEALPYVLKEYPETLYLVVGLGEEEVRLKQKVKEMHLESQVLFLGFIQDQDLPLCYAACNIFILPNREIVDPKDPWVGDFEGYGVVFIEASAAEKPVIGGNHGGALDAIVDGVTGILVDPIKPQEIASAVLKLFKDPALAQNLARQGRLRVEKDLNWPILLDQYEKIFESI